MAPVMSGGTCSNGTRGSDTRSSGGGGVHSGVSLLWCPRSNGAAVQSAKLVDLYGVYPPHLCCTVPIKKLVIFNSHLRIYHFFTLYSEQTQYNKVWLTDSHNCSCVSTR